LLVSGAGVGRLRRRSRRARYSWLDQLHHVSVGIVDADRAMEAELGLRGLDPAWRDEPLAAPRERRRRLGGVAGDEARLPVREVVGAESGGDRSAVARREVLEELDARARSRSETGNAEPRPEHVVQMLLLGAEILALACDRESEGVAIKAE